MRYKAISVAVLTGAAIAFAPVAYADDDSYDRHQQPEKPRLIRRRHI